VSLSQAGRTDLEVLRTVENAHDASITACAFSTSTAASVQPLVATADEAGAIHVYDFTNMYLLFRCIGHHSEVRALHFHCNAPLLISGDVSGVVFVWATTTLTTSSGESTPTYSIRPLMALLISDHSQLPRTPKTGGRTTSREKTSGVPERHDGGHIGSARPQRSGIASICSTVEPHASIFAGDINGVVHRWDLRALQHVAHKRGISPSHFEARQSVINDQSVSRDVNNAMSVDVTDAAFRPLLSQQQQPKRQQDQQLRFKHKMSILRLQGDDRHWFRGLPPTPSTSQLPLQVLSSELSTQSDLSHSHRGASIPGCYSSCAWEAHSGPVTGVSSVPFPGAVFSFSTDCSVKVWDWEGGSMGHFSTSKALPAASKQTAESNDSSQAPAWKFTRHLTGDESAQHSRIAMEVVRKFQQQSRRGQILPSPSTDHNELGCDDEYADIFNDSKQRLGKSTAASTQKMRLGDEAAIPFTGESLALLLACWWL
jgi:WD40 repeat protein